MIEGSKEVLGISKLARRTIIAGVTVFAVEVVVVVVPVLVVVLVLVLVVDVVDVVTTNDGSITYCHKSPIDRNDEMVCPPKQ